ncbi:hypothetical protein ILYODFUR_023052 [Ilyodon furcidens]|uniref:Secreted protein n=1 Tax=Ilyodon furcidens TaxID=33524 RepID=A0ABV0U9F3_9TELE
MSPDGAKLYLLAVFSLRLGTRLPLCQRLPPSDPLLCPPAGLSTQSINFSRREDRVKGNPLVQTGCSSPDMQWIPGSSGRLCA